MSDAVIVDYRGMTLDHTEMEVYGRYFRVQVADSRPLLEEIYRLRYQVYCIEHGFENAEDYLCGQETDQYDWHSVHAALVHRTTETVCGCVRLILPVSGCTLPITQLIREEQRAILPATRVAEVSRYAVSKAFRRRIGESQYADVLFHQLETPDPRRLMPHITLGLMVAVAALSTSYGISYLAAVMAPALMRLLQKCGMEFLPIGPLVDHHGKRQPCVASVDRLLDGIRTTHPAYFDVLCSGLTRCTPVVLGRG